MLPGGALEALELVCVHLGGDARVAMAEAAADGGQRPVPLKQRGAVAMTERVRADPG